MRIYLAGPLFSTAEREFNAHLAQLLRRGGHEVWLPQEHEDRRRTAAEIFRDDVAGIDSVDVVVANMDGSDPDSGTCWECGYAYGTKKRVVLFRTDFRAGDAADKAPYNFMLTESATRHLLRPLADTASVAAAILDALESLPRTPP